MMDGVGSANSYFGPEVSAGSPQGAGRRTLKKTCRRDEKHRPQSCAHALAKALAGQHGIVYRSCKAHPHEA
jgi:hypothetical protein